MPLFDLVILALIQGITEFLPISSSGHLVLWPLLTGRPDQGVALDVAVHLGTLVAVCLYFRAETARLAIGSVDLLRRRWDSADARLAFLVGVATIPAVGAGLALKLSGLLDGLRALEVIGWTTLIGGILLWLADRFGAETRGERPEGTAPGWRLSDAVLMGLAQAAALVPGTSRSGITMTAARALGFRRDEAARLALVMAIPVILAASLVEIGSLDPSDYSIREGAWVVGGPSVEGDPKLITFMIKNAVYFEMGTAAVLAFLSALAALFVMMRMFLAQWTMTPFVIYRLLLGIILLGLVYG